MPAPLAVCGWTFQDSAHHECLLFTQTAKQNRFQLQNPHRSQLTLVLVFTWDLAHGSHLIAFTHHCSLLKSTPISSSLFSRPTERKQNQLTAEQINHLHLHWFLDALWLQALRASSLTYVKSGTQAKCGNTN